MKIIGYGMCLPDKIIKNDELNERFQLEDDWIIKRTGIKERRSCVDENTFDLAYNAACDAIDNAKIDKEEIDMIICSSSSSEYTFPSLACRLHGALGIKKNIMCFDVLAACSGFVYSLDIANKYLNDETKNILIVGAEKLSSVVDKNDKNTSILFGDGAGAIIIQNDNRNNFVSYMKASGEKSNVLTLKTNGEKNYINMDGREVFMFACKVIPEVVNELITRNDITIEDIKYIIPHQANIRILQESAKSLNIPFEKYYVNLDKYGNTSAASIPIALKEMNDKGLLKSGDKLLVVAFGAGLTFGGMIIEL